jgi:hypothetical protein
MVSPPVSSTTPEVRTFRDATVAFELVPGFVLVAVYLTLASTLRGHTSKGSLLSSLVGVCVCPGSRESHNSGGSLAGASIAGPLIVLVTDEGLGSLYRQSGCPGVCLTARWVRARDIRSSHRFGPSGKGVSPNLADLHLVGRLIAFCSARCSAFASAGRLDPRLEEGSPAGSASTLLGNRL